MPIYKGNTEVASGNLYKGTTEIQDGYKGTNSFYVNEVSISWLNFPGVSDYIITGAPGDTITVSKSVSWTETAPAGSAYNGTQTASGVPADFSFTGGAQGAVSNTTTSPSVSFNANVFPASSTSVDYNNLTVTLPTSVIQTYSYSFTGGLANSTSCQAFSGSSCTVYSTSASAGNFTYFTASASGTGGVGANTCENYCAVSINSSGGSSQCDSSAQTAGQSATADVVAIPTYNPNPPPGYTSFNSAMYCVTLNSGSASSICGGAIIDTQTPNGWAGGGGASSSCGTPPAYEIPLPANGYKLIGRSINGGDSGTYGVRVRNGSGAVVVSDSTSMT